MKAQKLYDAQNDGVISGEDMQEFFFQQAGEYSISGKADVDSFAAVTLMKNSIKAQRHNSPSMAGWCDEMTTKYSLAFLG